MNLHIKVPIEIIEKQANAYFEETLLHNEEGGNIIDLKVTKKAPIQVISKDDYLLLSARLHVSANMKLKKQLLGVFDIYTPQVDQTEFDIEVQYRMKPVLISTWQFYTQTTGTFNWVEKPFMEMVVMKVSLAGILHPFIQAQVNIYAQKIDKWVAKELNIHEYVDEQWKILREPISLHDEVDLWLDMKLEADKVDVGTFIIAPNHLESSLHIPVQPEVIFGTPSVSRYEGTRILPDFHINNQLPKVPKRENTTAIIGFEALSNQLKNRHFKFDGGKQWLKVEYVHFGTKNDQLVAEAKIEGSIKFGLFSKKLSGTAYLQATPQYDKASKKLRLEGFSYKLESSDRLLNFGNRLGKRSFQNFLHEKLEQSANAALQRLPDFLEKQMQEVDMEDYADLKGTLNYLTVEEVYLTDEAVYIGGKVATDWTLTILG